MHITPIQFTDKPMYTKKASIQKDVNLERYLYSMHWETTELSNTMVENILVASCLRFLVGLTSIEFVIGLSQEIYKKYRTTMKLSLKYSIEILNTASQHLSEKDTLTEYVNDAIEVITKRKYYLSGVPESEQS